MKNIISIKIDSSDVCDLISSIDDGSNTLYLEVKTDINKHPKLDLDGIIVPITSNDFIYQIKNYTGDGEISFRIIEDGHTTDYYTIKRIEPFTEGSLLCKMIDNYSYELALHLKQVIRYDFLPLSGGTLSGALVIDNGDDDDSLNTSGNIVIGGSEKTGCTLFGTIRKCNDNRVNVSSFYTESDGSSKAEHNVDAFLKFDHNGFNVGYSGTRNVIPSETYRLLDSNNAYTKIQVDEMIYGILGGSS